MRLKLRKRKDGLQRTLVHRSRTLSFSTSRSPAYSFAIRMALLRIVRGRNRSRKLQTLLGQSDLNIFAFQTRLCFELLLNCALCFFGTREPGKRRTGLGTGERDILWSYVVPVGFQSEKHFRTINVQWIGQRGRFCSLFSLAERVRTLICLPFSHDADSGTAKIGEALQHPKIFFVELAVIMGGDPQGAQRFLSNINGND